jgi:aminoglycoside phosphotransferase (APT) family kinase protein
VLREIDVLNHKPGRRCTVRYVIGPAEKAYAVVGKWYRAPGQAPSMHALLASLLSTGISLPPLLFGSEHVVIQRFVAGQELRFLVHQEDTRPFAEAGEWLARLHSIESAPGLKHKSASHELAKVQGWCRELSETLPETAEALDALAKTLTAASSMLAEVRPAPIHRDYYPANLLWDGDTLWGIDFDQMALGDPALDAASFLAQLEKIVIRDGIDTRHLTAKTSAFVDAYRGSHKDDLGARVSFFKAYTFLKLAAAEVQRRRDRWEELTGAYLNRAYEEAAATR